MQIIIHYVLKMFTMKHDDEHQSEERVLIRSQEADARFAAAVLKVAVD